MSTITRRPRYLKRTVTRGHWPPIPLRRSTPTVDPPYADEPGADDWYREAAGQLAFDFASLSRPSRRGSATDLLPPPDPGSSSDAHRAARRFTRACLEILNGYRPAAHVRSLSQPTAAHTLVEQLFDALGRMPGPPQPPRRQTADLVRLRRLHISEPKPGVVEAAAAVGTDSRTWAMAFRLEHASTRWLGTVLQVL